MQEKKKVEQGRWDQDCQVAWWVETSKWWGREAR